MSEMGHHRFRSFKAWPFRNLGPSDHDDRQAKRPRGIDLGAGGLAAGILGDEVGNGVVFEQRAIPGFGERAAHPECDMMREGDALRSVDEAQQVEVFRASGESGDVLPPDGQKHPGRFSRQSRYSPGDIGDLLPSVTGSGLPGRPFERDKAGAGTSSRSHGIAAHARGERMRRVDQMRDFFCVQKLRQTVHPAEPADANRQGLGRRGFRPPCIGEDGVKAGFRQQARKASGVSRAAKEQDFTGPNSGQREAYHG